MPSSTNPTASPSISARSPASPTRSHCSNCQLNHITASLTTSQSTASHARGSPDYQPTLLNNDATVPLTTTCGRCLCTVCLLWLVLLLFSYTDKAAWEVTHMASQPSQEMYAMWNDLMAQSEMLMLDDTGLGFNSK